MAKQKGIIKLDGTIGDITFYKSADGYIAKEASGIPASRIATDPAFQRTRENMAEFGRAGKAGKTLRDAVRLLLQNAKDEKVASRLTKEMAMVIKADSTNPRGQRNVTDGDVALLEGFEFNIDASLGTTLYVPYTAVIDRTLGSGIISIPDFVPAEQVVAPAGATHFKLVTLLAEIDFENDKSIIMSQQTVYIPLNNDTQVALDLANTVTPASTQPLFLLLGIQFSQLVNGGQYPLKNGAFNALSIVKVEPNV